MKECNHLKLHNSSIFVLSCHLLSHCIGVSYILSTTVNKYSIHDCGDNEILPWMKEGVKMYIIVIEERYDCSD